MLFATLAIVLYAVQNVILEQKLARVPIAALIICFNIVILALAMSRWGFLRASGEAMAFPTGSLLVLTLAAGAVYFFADYCYLAAYANGGSLMSVTTVAIMLPVFASLVKFAWTRDLPNGWQITGYALAIAAVTLVAKGNQ